MKYGQITFGNARPVGCVAVARDGPVRLWPCCFAVREIVAHSPRSGFDQQLVPSP